MEVDALSIQEVWQSTLDVLKTEVQSHEYNIWLKPIQVELEQDKMFLMVPNMFFAQWIKKNYLSKIEVVVTSLQSEVKTIDVILASDRGQTQQESLQKEKPTPIKKDNKSTMNFQTDSGLNSKFDFTSFVEGSSNALAKAASESVAVNLGKEHNPLFVYGRSGLGKTHLMHAIGNLILKENPKAKVAYLHSERFVAEMVKALQTNAINEFKAHYRSVDALIIDDIQFFAGKDRSQEEFFHTFNALIEGKQQVIMTCDRYPKEIKGLEERLKSRFGWGLTVVIEPPELETRVAILMNKAKEAGVDLKYEVAFFIAKRIRSNVRELEGALKRVIANAKFTGREITMEFVKEALRDLISLQDKLVTLDNIQKTVADYFHIKVADLLSPRRSRSVARPRQIAMSLAKELTNHSLPEIGNAFGGRDHTTVIHACKTVNAMKKENSDLSEDYANLLRVLTT